MCLGFKPRAAGWKVRTNPLSYGGTPYLLIRPYSVLQINASKSSLTLRPHVVTAQKVLQSWSQVDDGNDLSVASAVAQTDFRVPTFVAKVNDVCVIVVVNVGSDGKVWRQYSGEMNNPKVCSFNGKDAISMTLKPLAQKISTKKIFARKR